MNVNTDGGKETEMTGKDKHDHDGHAHDHDHDGVAPHVHEDEEDCALESDVRTVYLDQGAGAH